MLNAKGGITDGVGYRNARENATRKSLGRESLLRTSTVGAEHLVQHHIAPNVTSRERVAVQAVALVSLVALEDGTPFVNAEVGMRGGLSLVADDGGEDEGANGLVKLIDAVVGEGGRIEGLGGVGRGGNLVLRLRKRSARHGRKRIRRISP